MNAADIADALGGRRVGGGFLARCPLADEHAHGDADPSFSIRDGDRGILVACRSRHADERGRVIDALKSRGLWPDPESRRAKRSTQKAIRTPDGNGGFELVSPVPSDAPDSDVTARRVYSSLAKTDATAWRFDYRTIEGEWSFSVYRFDSPTGKEIRPLSLWRDSSGSLEWRAKWPPGQLTPYGLERLSSSRLPVLITEGEKKADLAAEDLGGRYVVLSLPSGANAVKKADLRPLTGRDVTLWPDNDAAGFDAMIAVARKLESAQIERDGAITQSVSIVRPKADWLPGYDIADLLESGGDAAEFMANNCVGVEEFERLRRERFGAPSQTPVQIITPVAAEVARLATLPPLEYDPELRKVAKELGVRVKTLDDEVKALRRGGGSALTVPTWAPAKPHPEPVEGDTLLSDLIGVIRRFVMMDRRDALVVSLWVLFSHAFEHGAETNPFLRITSPLPGCGKSTLLKVLATLSRSGWLLSRLSPSAFVRTLGNERRTLLLDEGDAFLHENEAMRNLLDGASDPDTATVSFSVKQSDDWKPVTLNAFVPIAIASIGKLRGLETVESRSITVTLKRATSAERKALIKARKRNLRTTLEPLASRCARWVADNHSRFNRDPELPDALDGRDSDKWEAIVMIADAVSPEAGAEARAAALAASGQTERGDRPFTVMLLADLREIFDNVERLSSRQLCEHLAEIEGRPWGEYGRTRKPVTPHQLARLLADFAISSHTIRVSESTAKGYERGDFSDAWERYLNPGTEAPAHMVANSNRNNVTTQRGVKQNGDFQTGTDSSCDASKNDSLAHCEKGCGVVTVENRPDRNTHNLSGNEETEIDRLARQDAEGEEEVL